MKKITMFLFSLSLVFIIACGTTNNSLEEINIPEEQENIIDVHFFEGESASVLFPSKMVNVIRENSINIDSLNSRKKSISDSAMRWANMSDDELWDLIIDPELLRSWMVLSDGNCPTCGKSVAMYDWTIDTYNNPWKMTCPYCGESFPKNDFSAYYKSGLGEDGRFSYDRADSSLLFNVEHPDVDDPLHMYGVDDGRGYTDGENTWYFVATYNVKGNWRRYTYPAVKALSEAYVLTGEAIFAHKCAVLLDRLADVYSEYDFKKQGVLYEKFNDCTGYISYRVDAAVENLDLAIAFDKIVDGIREDEELISFLNSKAIKGGFTNKKENVEDIVLNIKTGLLKDIIDHEEKFICNFPHTEVTSIINKIILYWPNNREEIVKEIGEVITESTKKDGLSGESGLNSYASFTKGAINDLLQNIASLDDGEFIKGLMDTYPRLKDMYSFHVDTFCLDEYYPRVGDAGKFGIPFYRYNVGSAFDYYMLWELYDTTKDTKYLKAMYITNGMNARNMLDSVVPYLDNLDVIYDEIERVIDIEGYHINQASINKDEWQIGILRTGFDENRTALWLFYGLHSSHGHNDTMNIGLFSKGMELIPEIGYPEVGFGGWDSNIAAWAKHGFAHNKVITNRQQQVTAPDKTTLFATGVKIQAIRAQGRKNGVCDQYERTLALIDINDVDSYFIDISRINTTKGNYEMFIRGTVGEPTIDGFDLYEKDLEFSEEVFLKNFKGQENVDAGWSMDLDVEDFFGVNDPINRPHFTYLYDLKEKSDEWIDRDIHLKFTSLTRGMDAYIGESLACHYLDNGETKQLWIPVAIERMPEHLGETGTFIGIYEAYEDNSNIASISRLDLQYGSGKDSEDINIAANVKLKDGNEDLILSFDIANKESNNSLIQSDWGIETDCELCVIRKNIEGEIIYIAACKGTYLTVDNEKYTFDGSDELKEIIRD